ncbi:ribosome biogenesis GTPase Der [bacterium]|nr:ribosome biogenesis GTPase Der [bacterium]
MLNLPLVAIIGRPNVGKSTLFNRITRTRKAIVDKEAGITRDRQYAKTTWNGVGFILVDTGGLVPVSSKKIYTESDRKIEEEVTKQAQVAAEEADLIIFLTETELNPIDKEIANYLRGINTKVILAANKVDNSKKEHEIWELTSMGLGEPTPVSALHGRNTGDLLDLIIKEIPKLEVIQEDNYIRISVLGRPNVGKSSFVNKLLGENKLIVNPTPGTTRDAIDTYFSVDGRNFVITDTAGLKKKQYDLEYYSSLRTLNAIRTCDVAVLMIDITAGFVEQDKKIASTALSFFTSLVIALNKWDLAKDNGFTTEDYANAIYRESPFLSNTPVITISALNGTRVIETLNLLEQIYNERMKRYPTNDVNKLLEEIIEYYPPPGGRSRPKFLYATQQSTDPPTFIFFLKGANKLTRNYKTYIKNKLREKLGFIGTPMKLVFKEQKKKNSAVV